MYRSWVLVPIVCSWPLLVGWDSAWFFWCSLDWDLFRRDGWNKKLCRSISIPALLPPLTVSFRKSWVHAFLHRQGPYTKNILYLRGSSVPKLPPSSLYTWWVIDSVRYFLRPVACFFLLLALWMRMRCCRSISVMPSVSNFQGTVQPWNPIYICGSGESLMPLRVTQHRIQLSPHIISSGALAVWVPDNMYSRASLQLLTL